MNYTHSLKKVMNQVEVYKGIPLRQIDFGKWQYGIKTFTSIEDFKKFVDKIEDCKTVLKQ